MLEETTINKLIEMRFTAMADAFRSYRTDPKMRELPPEDFFGMLVDAEYTSRKNNRLKRLIRNAELEQRTACIADIDYASGRKLNKTLIKSLATCEYITEGRNIFITGATGSGKTYLACAFGMEALKQYFSVKFVRLPDMLLALETAREEKNYPKVLSRFIRPALLIIDEWLLMKVRPEDVNYIFEVIHKRCGHGSLILCSQFREEGWYDRLGVKDSPLADAIMDRIKHTAYQINIVSKDPAKDISMRELYGLSLTERE